jgi:hypothetical protein
MRKVAGLSSAMSRILSATSGLDRHTFPLRTERAVFIALPMQPPGIRRQCFWPSEFRARTLYHGGSDGPRARFPQN